MQFDRGGHEQDEMPLISCTTELLIYPISPNTSPRGMQQQGAERAADAGRQKQKMRTFAREINAAHTAEHYGGSEHKRDIDRPSSATRFFQRPNSHILIITTPASPLTARSKKLRNGIK